MIEIYIQKALYIKQIIYEKNYTWKRLYMKEIEYKKEYIQKNYT